MKSSANSKCIKIWVNMVNMINFESDYFATGIFNRWSSSLAKAYDPHLFIFKQDVEMKSGSTVTLG
jgi:hypothetical protein